MGLASKGGKRSQHMRTTNGESMYDVAIPTPSGSFTLKRVIEDSPEEVPVVLRPNQKAQLDYLLQQTNGGNGDGHKEGNGGNGHYKEKNALVERNFFNLCRKLNGERMSGGSNVTRSIDESLRVLDVEIGRRPQVFYSPIEREALREVTELLFYYKANFGGTPYYKRTIEVFKKKRADALREAKTRRSEMRMRPCYSVTFEVAAPTLRRLFEDF